MQDLLVVIRHELKNVHIEDGTMGAFDRVCERLSNRLSQNLIYKPEAFGAISDVSCDELKEICSLVVELTKLRQDGCKNLCIENFSPDLFATLLGYLSMSKKGKIYMPLKEDIAIKNPCSDFS